MFRLQLGHVEQNVSVYLRKFRSGGSWSWFGCPTCGKWARTLRLHLDDIVCPGCCTRRGIRPRASTLTRRQRAERRIPQLRAMLETETPLRLKSHHLRYSKLERRKRHEAALARCEFILSQGRRYRDVVVEEIPPEPIPEPKLKTTSDLADASHSEEATILNPSQQRSRLSRSRQTFRRHRQSREGAQHQSHRLTQTDLAQSAHSKRCARADGSVSHWRAVQDYWGDLQWQREASALGV